ncbi:unnamed protein product [Closterium sp. NIES-65]|nr:unnamed protein product [Closterium sp. NIES-65]
MQVLLYGSLSQSMLVLLTRILVSLAAVLPVQAGESRTARITRIELRITRIELRITRIELRITRIELRITRIELRITRIELRITRIELRITRIELRITRIELRGAAWCSGAEEKCRSKACCSPLHLVGAAANRLRLSSALLQMRLRKQLLKHGRRCTAEEQRYRVLLQLRMGAALHRRNFCSAMADVAGEEATLWTCEC